MNNLTFQTLTPTAASSVIHRLWERGIQEAMIFGIHSDKDMFDYCMRRMYDQHAYSAWLEDDPIAVFGAFPVGGGMYRTWFLATDEFEDCFMALTRRLRQLIEKESVEAGATAVEIFSACIHPKAARWFGLLGLEPDNDYNSEQGSGMQRFVREFGGG